MAIKQYTRSDIYTKIETDFADNTTKAISAADLRGVVKDYMTSSTYAPVMIYAGILKQKDGSGGGDDPAYIQDLYYNPDFFRQQDTSDPDDATNPVSLNDTSASGAADGVQTFNIGTGVYTMNLKLTIASGVITAMEVTKPGYGLYVGQTGTFTIASGPTKTWTYNGVITSNGSIGDSHRFNLSVNANLDATVRDHKAINTIISTTPKDLGLAGSNLDMENEMTADNTLKAYLDTDTTSHSKHYQHVQLYRIAG